MRPSHIHSLLFLFLALLCTTTLAIPKQSNNGNQQYAFCPQENTTCDQRKPDEVRTKACGRVSRIVEFAAYLESGEFKGMWFRKGSGFDWRHPSREDFTMDKCCRSRELRIHGGCDFQVVGQASSRSS